MIYVSDLGGNIWRMPCIRCLALCAVILLRCLLSRNVILVALKEGEKARVFEWMYAVEDDEGFEDFDDNEDGEQRESDEFTSLVTSN